jgi:hypothetical protein
MPVTKTDWSQPASAGVNQSQSGLGGGGYFSDIPTYAPAEVSPYQGVIDAADTALANLAAQQYASEQRQRRFADKVAIQDALALQRQQAERLAAEQYQRRIADRAAVRYGSALERGRLNNQIRSDMAKAYSGVTNFGMGPMVPLGSDIYPDTFSSFTPGQQASLNQYLQRGPGKDYSFGIVPGIMGLLGAPTQYEQITSGDYRPVFVGDEFYGSFGAGPFGGQVYTGRTLPPDVAAEYGIPGFEDTSGDPTVVAPVADALTGEQRCPEGYIFDEDLQACRLDTPAPVAKALEQREPTRTYSLLDQAPDGLLEFQRRYGLPQQQMDFSLLT